MAEYDTQFSCQLDVGTQSNAAEALAIFQQLALDLHEREGATPGFAVELDEPGVLWIHDADSDGDPEHVIAFVLRCADAFQLSGRWGFAWALSCSRPRLEGFGGGAQMLDLGARASLGWIDCDHWLATLRREPDAPTGGEGVRQPDRA